MAHPDETLRAVADRMVASEHGVLPVVARDGPRRLAGVVTQLHLLAAHRRVLVEESLRERHLSGGLPEGVWGVASKHRITMFPGRMVMSRDSELGIKVVGYQVRSADGSSVIGEIEGVRPRGIRVHKLTGHPRQAGYVPQEMIEGVEASTNTVFLAAGIGVEQVTGAPPPPDESPDGWHKSSDWWADLLGHYGLFVSEGRKSEPYLHADQK